MHHMTTKIMQAPVADVNVDRGETSSSSLSSPRTDVFQQLPVNAISDNARSGREHRNLEQQKYPNEREEFVDVTARRPPRLDINQKHLRGSRGRRLELVGHLSRRLSSSSVRNPSFPTMAQKPNQLPANSTGRITHQCLLIPVFVAAWWYWSRKTYRKVVSKLIKDTPEPETNEGRCSSRSMYTRW